MDTKFISRSLALSLILAIVSPAQGEVYQWTDENGQVHFGDSDVLPPGAEKAVLGPVNTLPPPPPETEREPDQSPGSAAPLPTTAATAVDWANEHCQVRIRILYTERYYIPCVPTDEVQVYICDRKPPRNYRGFFGRQYRYEDRESECGPEVFEGERLYIKK